MKEKDYLDRKRKFFNPKSLHSEHMMIIGVKQYESLMKEVRL